MTKAKLKKKLKKVMATLKKPASESEKAINLAFDLKDLQKKG